MKSKSKSMSEFIEDLENIKLNSSFQMESLKEDFVLDLIIPETKELNKNERWEKWTIKKRNHKLNLIIGEDKSKLVKDILLKSGKAVVVDVTKTKLEIDFYSNGSVVRKAFKIYPSTVFVSPGVYTTEVDITNFGGKLKMSLLNGK